MNFAKAFIFIAIAEALIYLGICFLSGQLLPTALSEVYREWPRWLKLVVFAAVVSIPANLLISWGFRETGPSFAGVVYATFAVIGAMASAVLIDGAVIRLNVFVAFVVMIVSAGYAIVALRSTIP